MAEPQNFLPNFLTLSLITHFQIAELLPGILTQLGSEGLSHLKRLANNVVGSKVLGSVQEEDGKDEDMEIPDLVDNFENVANAAEPTAAAVEKQAEEIVAKIAKATIEEAAKPTTPAPAPAKATPPTAAAANPAPAAAAAPAEDKKKDTKKESAPKKSPNDNKNKKQQSKDKKAWAQGAVI